MERFIHSQLLDWKNKTSRKVLLLRGARQVGKTWSVRNLAKGFKYYLEVNFEKDRAIRSFFAGDLDTSKIITLLSAYYDIPIIPGETLLFFDEIQAYEPALSSLRFFYEKQPDLHVVAAGSLLEFALNKLPSFGIGRIEHLFMYPLSFQEFLIAKGKKNLIGMINQSGPESPIETVFHDMLIEILKEFLYVGGLPEIVNNYISNGDLREAQHLLDQHLTGLLDDLNKYRQRFPSTRLREIFDAVVHQSGNRFKLAHASRVANYYQILEALDLLEMAGLIYRVFHTSAGGVPAGSQADHSKFKILMFDHGLFQRILGLNLSEHLLANDFSAINKGNIAEQFAGTEIIKNSPNHGKTQLYYWQRETPGSHAEVDYILQSEGRILPFEIKSGTSGKMQSLHLFLREKKLPSGIRCSLENFNKYDNIEVYPLYAIRNICK